MSHVNTEIFSSWIEQDLLPKLSENSAITMDNASFHKGSAMQEQIMEAGHIFEYLPPYSLDLNPTHETMGTRKINKQERRILNK